MCINILRRYNTTLNITKKICTFFIFSAGKLMAKLSIGEQKQFSDSRTTFEANKHNFKADYALTTVEGYNYNNRYRKQGIPFEMKVTELNTDTTYGRIVANFANKVG